MSKSFTIRDKLLSLRGRIQIVDNNDQVIYDAHQKFSLFRSIWMLSRSQAWIATITRQLLCWSPTWIIQTSLGNFTISRKLFSLSRTYRLSGDDNVSGDNNADLTLHGNLWDKDFTLTKGDRRIAAATGKWFSLRDAQTIELLSNEPEDELLTIIAMVTLHLDRKQEGRAVGGD